MIFGKLVRIKACDLEELLKVGLSCSEWCVSLWGRVIIDNITFIVLIISSQGCFFRCDCSITVCT